VVQYATSDERVMELHRAGVTASLVDVWAHSERLGDQHEAAAALDKLSANTTVRTDMARLSAGAVVRVASGRVHRFVLVLEALAKLGSGTKRLQLPGSEELAAEGASHDEVPDEGMSLVSLQPPAGSKGRPGAGSTVLGGMPSSASVAAPPGMAGAASHIAELAAAVEDGARCGTLFSSVSLEGAPDAVSLPSELLDPAPGASLGVPAPGTPAGDGNVVVNVTSASEACVSALRVVWRLIWHKAVSDALCAAGDFPSDISRLVSCPVESIRRSAAVVIGSLVHQEPNRFAGVGLPGALLSEASHVRNRPETLRQLVHALYWTASAGEAWAAALVRRNGCRLAVPLMYHDAPPVSFRACQFGAALASYDGPVREAVRASGVLDHVRKIARATRPEELGARGTGGPSVLQRRASQLSRDMPDEVRLVAVISIAAHLDPLCFDAEHRPGAEAAVRHGRTLAPLIAGLRDCAAGADVLTYYHAIRCLDLLGEAKPLFSARGPDNGPWGADTDGGRPDPKPVADWDIAAVGDWVSHQPFRAYRPAFTSALVDGETLPMLDDGLLEAMGVTHPVHRLSIVNAVRRLLRTEGAAAATTPAEGAGAAEAAEETPAALRSQPRRRFDVFLSYRRQGGSQLAQLLKIYLEAAGLVVFMDTDTLGRGDFVENLKDCLRSSRNVVSICTKGALDRCCDPVEGPGDFVRIELALAREGGINVVPVFHEFNFEIRDKLPAETRHAIGQNGVMWQHEYSTACVDRLCRLLLTE